MDWYMLGLGMKFLIPVKPGTNTFVNLRNLVIYQDGGYSYYFLVPNYKHLIKLEEVDFNSSAALACSGWTAYTSIINSLAMPGENLLIIGAGGLGLMTVQIPQAITNSNIIILDVC